MLRQGTTSIILAVFLLTALSGCLGSEDEGPKGPTTVSETAKGTEISEFSFEPVKMSPTATVSKASKAEQYGTTCIDPIYHDCKERKNFQFNWSIEGLTDLSTADGATGEVFYQIWFGEGEGENVKWFGQSPVPAKDGKIEGNTKYERKWGSYTHFRLSIETKQDADAEVVLFEQNGIEDGSSYDPEFAKPFASSFGTANLAPGAKEGSVNLTATAIGLPTIPGGYDAWLVTGGETTRLGRLAVDPDSGGLAVTVGVEESKIANEWSVFVSYEPGITNDDPSGLQVLKAQFAT